MVRWDEEKDFVFNFCHIIDIDCGGGRWIAFWFTFSSSNPDAKFTDETFLIVLIVLSILLSAINWYFL